MNKNTFYEENKKKRGGREGKSEIKQTHDLQI